MEEQQRLAEEHLRQAAEIGMGSTISPWKPYRIF